MAGPPNATQSDYELGRNLDDEWDLQSVIHTEGSETRSDGEVDDRNNLEAIKQVQRTNVVDSDRSHYRNLGEQLHDELFDVDENKQRVIPLLIKLLSGNQMVHKSGINIAMLAESEFSLVEMQAGEVFTPMDGQYLYVNLTGSVAWINQAGIALQHLDAGDTFTYSQTANVGSENRQDFPSLGAPSGAVACCAGSRATFVALQLEPNLRERLERSDEHFTRLVTAVCSTCKPSAQRTKKDVENIAAYLSWHEIFENIPMNNLENIAWNIQLEFLRPGMVIGVHGKKPTKMMIVIRGAVSAWRIFEGGSGFESIAHPLSEEQEYCAKLIAETSARVFEIKLAREENMTKLLSQRRPTPFRQQLANITTTSCVEFVMHCQAIRTIEWAMARDCNINATLVVHGPRDGGALCFTIKRSVYRRYVQANRRAAALLEASLWTMVHLDPMTAKPADMFWILNTRVGDSPVFKAIPFPIQLMILRCCKYVSFEKGETLFRKGSEVAAAYLLLRGKLKLNAGEYELGARAKERVATPGAFIGQWCLAKSIGKEIWQHEIVAEERCELISIPARARLVATLRQACNTASLVEHELSSNDVSTATEVLKFRGERSPEHLEILSSLLQCFDDFACVLPKVVRELSRWVYSRTLEKDDLISAAALAKAGFCGVLCGQVCIMAPGENDEYVGVIELPSYNTICQLPWNCRDANKRLFENALIRAMETTSLLCLDLEYFGRVHRHLGQGCEDRGTAIEALKSSPSHRTADDIIVLGRLLRGNSFFAQFDDKIRGQVCRSMKWKAFEKDTYICKQGDTATACYILIKGTADIIRIPEDQFDPFQNDETNFAEDIVVDHAAAAFERGLQNTRRHGDAGRFRDKGTTLQLKALKIKFLAWAALSGKMRRTSSSTNGGVNAVGQKRNVESKQAIEEAKDRTSITTADDANEKASRKERDENKFSIKNDDGRTFMTTTGEEENDTQKASDQDPTAKAVTIATMVEGSTFGEFGLLHGDPRSASVLCKTRCEVAVIEKSTFCLTVRKGMLEKEEMITQFFREYLPVAKSGVAYHGLIAKHMRDKILRIGSLLCKAGRKSTKFWVIKSGICRIIGRDVDGHTKDYGQLCAGQVAGVTSAFLEKSEPFSIICATASVELMYMTCEEARRWVHAHAQVAFIDAQEIRANRITQRIKKNTTTIAFSKTRDEDAPDEFLESPYLKHKLAFLLRQPVDKNFWGCLAKHAPESIRNSRRKVQFEDAAVKNAGYIEKKNQRKRRDTLTRTQMIANGPSGLENEKGRSRKRSFTARGSAQSVWSLMKNVKGDPSLVGKLDETFLPLTIRSLRGRSAGVVEKEEMGQEQLQTVDNNSKTNQIVPVPCANPISQEFVQDPLPENQLVVGIEGEENSNNTEMVCNIHLEDVGSTSQNIDAESRCSNMWQQFVADQSCASLHEPQNLIRMTGHCNISQASRESSGHVDSEGSCIVANDPSDQTEGTGTNGSLKLWAETASSPRFPKVSNESLKLWAETASSPRFLTPGASGNPEKAEFKIIANAPIQKQQRLPGALSAGSLTKRRFSTNCKEPLNFSGVVSSTRGTIQAKAIPLTPMRAEKCSDANGLSMVGSSGLNEKSLVAAYAGTGIARRLCRPRSAGTQGVVQADARMLQELLSPQLPPGPKPTRRREIYKSPDVKDLWVTVQQWGGNATNKSE